MLHRQLDFIMDAAADGAAEDRHAPDEHIDVFAVIECRLEVRQRDDLRRARGQHAECEIDGHAQKPLFTHQIAKALFDVAQELAARGMLLFERERGTLLFDVVFLGADLRLRRRGDEEAQRVDAEQRRNAEEIIKVRCDRDDERRERLQHARDGVGLGVVPLRDQQGIEAVVGDIVDAVDRADDKAEDREHRKAEPAAAQDQCSDKVDPGGKEVQRVDRLLARKAVEDRAREDRHDDLRQRKCRNIDGIEQVRARVIQYEQAQREAGHRIAQHRDHAAQCDDSEIPRPQR